MHDTADGAGFRLTELVASISLATDLGTGQPIEHALRTCELSMSVAAALGLGPADAADVHYVALLRFLGCTADTRRPRSSPAATPPRSCPRWRPWRWVAAARPSRP